MTTDNGLRKVRTTIEPDRVLEVNDAEYADLEYQGLLVTEGKQKTAAGTSAAKNEEK